MVESIIFATLEEIFKATMCRAISWRSWWIIPALAFAIFEAALKIPLFLELPCDLADTNLKGIAAFLAAVGTSIFHFYTNLLYLNSRRLWPKTPRVVGDCGTDHHISTSYHALREWSL